MTTRRPRGPAGAPQGRACRLRPPVLSGPAACQRPGPSPGRTVSVSTSLARGARAQAPVKGAGGRGGGLDSSGLGGRRDPRPEASRLALAGPAGKAASATTLGLSQLSA